MNLRGAVMPQKFKLRWEQCQFKLRLAQGFIAS